jgi:hypothetical protein
VSAAPSGIDPRRAPGPALRALALKLLDDALARLPRGDARAVHEARRTCKQLRALLRLVRPRLGADYAAGNLGLRDAGRALAADRDAKVRRDTARVLFAHDAELRRELARALRNRAPRDGDRDADLADALRRLRRERRRIAGWKLGRLSSRQLAAGLRRGYARARKGYRASRRHPDAPTLHEWRKQVKYHLHQLALVAPRGPRAGARVRALGTLGDGLGWHHDLHMLELALDGLPRDARQVAAKARRRGAHEQALAAREALKLGKILFAGKPQAWRESLS